MDKSKTILKNMLNEIKIIKKKNQYLIIQKNK